MSEAASPPSSSRRIWAIVQIAGSVGLLAALIAFVDFGALVARFRDADPAWMLLGIAAGLLQLAMLGLRWWALNRKIHLAAPLGAGDHVMLTGLTHAASQVLPSSIGGDAVRVIVLKRCGVALAEAMLSVLSDRVAGLLGLLALVLFGLLLGGVPEGAENAALAAGIAALLGVGGVIIAPWIATSPRVTRLAARFGLERPLAASAALMRDPVAAFGILMLSVLPHALNVVMAWSAAHALNLPVGWEVLTLAVPLALLVMTLPVSVAGWGVREAVLVFVLGGAGFAAHDALAVSVTWGALLLAVGLIAALPALLWLARKR